MISIVLYGRNDSYGYNLHKRAALSLNCMAEVLTDSSDEILFVDYNTPDDYPTFPEAIQDTLTKRAREILRILRVRPSVHERFRSRTHLVALEPVARNVAIRRSNPSNRWILSTNTDMIFIPQASGSLSQITRGLAPGFYHAPRIEIPEVLWESFDRHAPAETISTVREWGTALHLNEIILGSSYILYDGPGDFQLLLRSDLFENQGFHEGMLLGWHVDSNIAKRMHVKYGIVGDLGSKVYGYHCDHTRQVTPAHSHVRIQNDWRLFCDEVETSDIPEQADTWGCANDTIEEVRLVANPASVYVQALRESVGKPLDRSPIVKYTHETYNKISYDPRHLVPFLADMFVAMPRNVNLAWYGAGIEMLSRFAVVWLKLGFTGKILADRELLEQKDLAEGVVSDSTSDMLDAADVFVFDFGDLPGSPRDSQSSARKQLSDGLQRRFQRVVRAERRRLTAGLPPRRVIALNAINNQYEAFVTGCVAAAATPCATHMRHGYVLPAEAKEDWLPLLHIGQAGVRVKDRVKSDPRKLGAITYGPYKFLDEGRYRLSIRIDLSTDDFDRPGNEPCVVIEVRTGSEFLGVYLIRRQALRSKDHEFVFEVSTAAAEGAEGVETRISLLTRMELSIRSMTIELLPAVSNEAAVGVPAAALPIPLRIADWLPYLSSGPLGRADDVGVTALSGRPEYVVFGPYWPLPTGKYQLTAKIEALNERPNSKHLIRADVAIASGEHKLVSANFSLGRLPRDENDGLRLLRLPFDVRSRNSDQQLIETRIWSSGEEQFRIRSLSVTPAERRQQEDLYPFLLVGEIGSRVSGELQSVDERVGLVGYSQAIELDPGRYRLSFRVLIETDGERPPRQGQTCVIAFVKHGFDILAVNAITFGAKQGDERDLQFEVSSDSAAIGGVEFFFKVVTAASVLLRELTLKRVAIASRQTGPAICDLDNWLPFLQTSPSARADQDGVFVNGGGRPEYPVCGPYWTLPPGRYEMIASIVPHPSSREGNPVITGEVVAEGGARLFAAGKWRLGQFQCGDGYEAIEVRLPFKLGADLAPDSRAIETRIYNPGNASFRVRTMAVKVRSEEPVRDWFPYLTVAESGIHTGREIRTIAGKTGYVASTPPMTVTPGHYKSLLDFGTDRADSLGVDFFALEAWSGQDLVAIKKGRAGSQSLEFDVTETLAESGIEIRIRVIAPTDFTIRGFVVEKTSRTVAPSLVPAALKLPDWVPFLQVGPSAHSDQRGIVVREGYEEYVVYGPFWALPAGRYEMVASIIPHRSTRDNNPIITGQIAAEDGARLFAAGRWRLGQYQFADADTSAEFHLPFTLDSDLPATSRRIETRIFSPGNARFRILSLVVKVRGDEPGRNWFAYLIVGACGIHTGREIRSTQEIGCVAATPAITITPGHYKLFPDIGVDSAGSNSIALEIWSGSELIAIEVRNAGTDQPLEFDATEKIARSGIELRILAIAPVAFSIRGLVLEKASETAAPALVPAVLRHQDWLPFLLVGTAGRRVGRNVIAERGQVGDVVHGPYWPLAPGRYEMLVAIDRNAARSASTGAWNIKTLSQNIKAALASFEESLPKGGAEVMLNGRPVARAERFVIGPPFSSFASAWLPFEIADSDAKTESRVETHIWSNGGAGFRVSSVIVRRRTASSLIHSRRIWSGIHSTAIRMLKRNRAKKADVATKRGY